MKNNKKIIVSKDGPYIVCGNLPLAKKIYDTDDNGEPGTYKKGDSYPDKKQYALCRCGKSNNKPYCDGTHIKTKFNGKETAGRESYLNQADKISGPDLDLTDAQVFCSGGRFCHKGTWEHAEKSDNKKSKEIAIDTACKCPSGRLVAWDKKTGKAIEEKFDPSLDLLEDKAAKVSGPIQVKGGVEIESENGKNYETRNRVTLCRCGHSNNKPFCDGSHLDVELNDGDKSVN